MTLVAIPRAALAAAVADNEAARNAFETAVLDRMSGFPSTRPRTRARGGETVVPNSVILGWVLTILTPIAILIFMPRNVIGHDAVSYLTILSAGIYLWGFGLVEEFIPGLIMLCAILAMGLVPPAVALSGF